MMRPEQEPKYDVVAQGPEVGRLYNRATGIAIPDDEPVFILRARDRYAAAAIEHYAVMCLDPEHVAIVEQRAADFRAFAAAHPDRMKEPDSPA